MLGPAVTMASKCLVLMLTLSQLTPGSQLGDITAEVSASARTHRTADVSRRRQLNIAVIAPANVSHPYALPKILPAILLAVSELEDMGENSPLPGWNIQLRYHDSNCSSSLGPIAAFEMLYINKTAGHVRRLGSSFGWSNGVGCRFYAAIFIMNVVLGFYSGS